MLCLAQSDNIVFIYKLGKSWGDRKCICNKFKASSSVTCLTWPKSYQGGVVFGLAEGHVKIGLTRSNKTGVLYKTKSYVVSIASPDKGKSIISGHLDGSIYIYHIDKKNGRKLLTHSSIPYALAWGEKIVAAGNNGIVTFYDT
jgi:intraflagellar transport protein 172